MTIQRTKTTITKAIGILLFALLISINSNAQKGNQGAITISGSNQDVNSRTWLTADAASGATTITVNNSALNGTYFIGSLSSGDLIMVIQMQGASINTSNSSNYGSITNYNGVGQYEIRCVASTPNSTSIMVTVPLSNNYSASAHTQIIRIPRYTSFTLPSGNSISPSAWNGNEGGVSIIEVSANATINGSFDATGRGFRGGAFENNTQPSSANITIFYSNDDADGGNKGEGIAGFETEYDALGGQFGRGAPANAGGGGNSHNAGGGGGANAGNISGWNGLGNPDNSGFNWNRAWDLEGGSFSSNTSSGGGRGGYTYGRSNQNAITLAPGNSSWSGNSRKNIGGYGGRPLNYSTGRIFMGGGGGAGDGNNNAASGGANGGGIIFIICYGNINGNGNIISNGATALNTSAGHNDAPGGGGGGGTIILSSNGSISNSLTLNADGGNGGNQLITNTESEGPGGGGGGGYIAISSGSPTRTTNAGLNGTTSSSALTEFIPNGATKGDVGINNASYNSVGVIDMVMADAGIDQDYCETANMNGSNSSNAIGTWSVIFGIGGSFSDIHDPFAVFTGDSFATYHIEWAVINNLCESASDTMILTPICIPLPVTLVKFQGEYIDNQVMLEWITATEESMFAYRIERKNKNNDWTDIGGVFVEGNSNTLKSYTFNDENPSLGENNYRLKLTNNDQTFVYSKVISIYISTIKNKFIAYPVPVSDVLIIEGQFKKDVEVMVYNIQGQILETVNGNGSEKINIDFNNYQTGIYLIKIMRGGEILQTQSIFRE